MTLQTMPRRQSLPAPLAPFVPFKPREYRTLDCLVCETATEFRLSTDGDRYECTECGWDMDYTINIDRPMYAIHLCGGLIERSIHGLRHDIQG